MNDFLAFKKMITPVFIQVIFWVGIVAIVFSGFAMMFSGGVANAFMGLFMIVLGGIFWRVWCEIIILLFRIHENLAAIRESKGA